MEKPEKISGKIRLMTVSQRQMAAAIGLSATRVNELINENVMVRDPSGADGRLMLFESLENYFSSRQGSNDGANFWKERSLHERAKRELAELKLAERRGELYEAANVEMTLAEIFTDFRNKMLGIGHKLGKRLEGKSAGLISAMIDEEITVALNELSEGLSVAKYKLPHA